MFKIVLWLLAIPDGEKSGKSGKREVAVLFALFSAVMVILLGLDPELGANQLALLQWLVTASVVMLMYAFGMEALVHQMNFKWPEDKR